MFWQLVWNRLSRDWRVVSREEAAQTRYYGLRGWLLLFYLLAAGSVVTNAIDLMSPPHAGYVEVYGDRPAVIRAVLLVYLAAQLPFLVLAPLKHRLMPRAWLAGIWVAAVTFVAAIDMPGRTDGMVLRVALTLCCAALMSWYVLHAKRVNVTYLQRVPADPADFAKPASPTVRKKDLPSPHLYQRARKANRIFWGLAALAVLAALASVFAK